MSSKPWFEVDKEGLAKLMDRKGGKQFVVFELIQNAWDEKSTRVDVEFRKHDGAPRATLIVRDDNPEGFVNLSHAFTLFAESTKKNDPTKRGRFNLGEKLVLACCIEASISTTKGTVVFEGNHRRTERTTTSAGSVFTGLMKMNQEEFIEICDSIWRLLPPKHIITTFNGDVIPARNPVASFSVPLMTEVADAEGVLRRTTRTTQVDVYQPRNGDIAAIYELGIPVVATGDKYHVDVGQKVPVNMDRDNVPPAYLRDLRTHVLNATYNLLQKEDVTHPWVRDASADEEAEPEAIKKVMLMRFGEKAVAYDPTDPEANQIAASEGRPVIYGGSMSSGEWNNVRRVSMVLPAGQVTPSPKPFSPDGKPLKCIDESDWSSKMQDIRDHLIWVAAAIRVPLHKIRITNDVTWPFGGCYGDGELIINRGRMGKDFFEDFPNNMERVLEFFIHELGHHFGTHLTEEYYQGLCKVGARMVVLALKHRERYPKMKEPEPA